MLYQTVVTTFSQRFFVTLYQNVLQTLRKLSKKACINVLPKRFHNQIKTLSQRFHNVFLLAGLRVRTGLTSFSLPPRETMDP